MKNKFNKKLRTGIAVETRLIAFLLFIALLAIAPAAKAQDSYPEYISEVKVVGYKQTDDRKITINFVKSDNPGWTVIEHDLNEGAGGRYIYLLYKEASRANTNGGYVTDFKLMTYDEEQTNLSDVNINGTTYTLCPAGGDTDFCNAHGDVNNGAGGTYLYLYYTKANFSDKRAVSGIKFISTGTKDPNNTNYVFYGNQNNSADFNQGAEGPHIYMQLTTATKSNRPSNDPVMASGLTFNGDPQALLTINNSNTGTMMYRVGESGDFSSSIPTATNAGNYTVYYYADADGYGNKSETKSKTVSITKLWDQDANGNYLITSVADLNALSTFVNSGHDCSEMSFKVTQDINFNPSSNTTNNFTAIGNNTNRFNGHFDGNDKTISGIRINSTNEYQGLFGCLSPNALVEKIKLANTIITGSNYTGGIAGANYGTIQNCTVESSVTINPAQNSTYYLGGIVGDNHETVLGCICSVTLTKLSNCRYFGGIAGATSEELEGNLVINANIPAVDKYYGAITGYYRRDFKNNFYRNCKVGNTEKATNVGCNNSDITSNNGAVSLHTITLCSGITTSKSATKTYDGTSYYAKGTGLTLSYESGKHFLANGYLVNGTYYEMPAADVTFTRCYLVNYNLDGGTLPSGTANPTIYTSGTLTLPTPTRDYYTFDGWYQGSTKKTTISGITADVTLTAKWTPVEYKITYYPSGGALPDGIANPTSYTVESDEITLPTPTRDYYTFSGWYDNEDFTGDPITSIDPTATHANVELYAKWDFLTITEIYTTDDLIAFSNTVNAGNGYSGKTVTLMNDIDFKPTDGTTNNFTAIGIGIYFYGTFDGQGHTISGIRINTESSYQGLFGMNANSAIVKNLTIDNAVIASSSSYVGGIVGLNWGTISNCIVTNNVKLTANSSCGGVTGNNEGTISNCVVSNDVELTANSLYCGGVVGLNSTDGSLSNNLVIGATIIANHYQGAIAGDNNGTLQNNFYYNTTVNRASTEVGCNGADIEDQNGAVPPDLIIDGDSESPVAITESNAGANVLYLRKLKKCVTSTITLPFDFDASSMDGIFYQLTSVNTDAWIAGAHKVEFLSTNTPYLFLPNADIEQVMFPDVTLTPTTGKNSVTIDDNWTFHGVYEKILWETAPKNHYGFSAVANGDNIAAGDFVKIGQYVRIKPTRAYLTYDDGISKSSIVLPDRIQVVFSDEEIASVIDPIDNPTDDPTEDITTPVSELPAQASNVKVWSYEKTIYIQAAPMTDYRIIDATGRVLRSATTQTNRDEIRLGNLSGIVIVIINNKTYKINY